MIRNVIAGLTLIATLSGCLGHNALQRRVLRFNLTAAEGHATREALFVGMWIIPAYLIAALVDLFVINSIEFWTGKNPLNGKGALVDLPKSEFRNFGIEGIDVARVERLTETQADLYVEFVNGDRVTFAVIREGDQYTISYGGVEFYRGDLKL